MPSDKGTLLKKILAKDTLWVLKRFFEHPKGSWNWQIRKYSNYFNVQNVDIWWFMYSNKNSPSLLKSSRIFSVRTFTVFLSAISFMTRFSPTLWKCRSKARIKLTSRSVTWSSCSGVSGDSIVSRINLIKVLSKWSEIQKCTPSQVKSRKSTGTKFTTIVE